jgi:hypothetical protein
MLRTRHFTLKHRFFWEPICSLLEMIGEANVSGISTSLKEKCKLPWTFSKRGFLEIIWIEKGHTWNNTMFWNPSAHNAIRYQRNWSACMHICCCLFPHTCLSLSESTPLYFLRTCWIPRGPSRLLINYMELSMQRENLVRDLCLLYPIEVTQNIGA